MRKSINWNNYIMRKYGHSIRQNVISAAMVSVKARHILKMDTKNKTLSNSNGNTEGTN